MTAPLRALARILGTLSAAAVLLALAVVPAAAAHGPARPQNWVTDQTRTLSSETVTRLNGAIDAHEKKTGNEIGVLIIPTLSGMAIEDYAHKTFNEWGIGKKDRDNGILLLIAKNDRKLRIEVGRGLEAYVTDGSAGEIIRSAITPKLKAGDWDGAVSAGVSQIIQRLEAAPAAPAPARQPTDADGALVVIIVLGVILVIGAAALQTFQSGRQWPQTYESLDGPSYTVRKTAFDRGAGRARSRYRSSEDDDVASIIGTTAAASGWSSSRRRSSDDDDDSSSSSSGGSSFGGFGGGSSGGGGASGGW